MEVQTNGDTISSNIQTSTQDTVTSINSDNTNINHNYFNTETSGAYYKRYVTDNDWLSQLEPKKKTQVLIIIGAVAIIIFYMIVTVVIPSVYNTIHNFTEKRRLLQKLKQEIDNTEIEDISAIPIIPKEKEKKSFVKHRPNFALRAEEDANDNISRSLRDEDSVNGKSDIQYKKSSDRIINNTKRKSVRSTPAYQPSNSAYIAPENPFYSNYNFSSGASVSSALDESRALRLAQDAEYEESLRADREKKEKELKKKEALDKAKKRMQELREKFTDEIKNNENSVAISFRCKGVTGPIAAIDNKKNSNIRIQRKFRKDDTVEILMDFVESRDLRTSAVSPPPFYLTLSYPNRVINRESNQSQTLEEIGINGDCVIWVTFEDDK